MLEVREVERVFKDCANYAEQNIKKVFIKLKQKCKTVAELQLTISTLDKKFRYSLENRAQYGAYIDMLQIMLSEDVSNMEIPHCSHED